MVEPRYNHTCDIFRLTRTGNTDAYSPTAVYEDIPFQILPAGPDIAAVFGSGPAFAQYEIWTGKDVTLKNGDKVVSGDRSWIVQGEPQVVDDPLMFYVRVIGQEAV